MLFALMLHVYGVSAQQQGSGQQGQQTQQSQAGQQIIKPTFHFEDVIIVLQSLNNVELTGNEIDAFLNAKRFLQLTIKKAQDKNLQAADTISTELTIQNAQEILTFMQRGKITGANVEKYKRFVDAMVAAAKAVAPPAGNQQK
jgi:hypothetical protein